MIIMAKTNGSNPNTDAATCQERNEIRGKHPTAGSPSLQHCQYDNVCCKDPLESLLLDTNIQGTDRNTQRTGPPLAEPLIHTIVQPHPHPDVGSSSTSLRGSTVCASASSDRRYPEQKKTFFALWPARVVARCCWHTCEVKITRNCRLGLPLA